MLDLVSKVYSPVRERCGFILKSGEILEVNNIDPNPDKNFAIDIEDINANIENILAFWHNHTGDNYNLSSADYKAFMAYPEHLHIIFCYDIYTIYRVRNNLLVRLDYANNSEFSSRFATLIS